MRIVGIDPGAAGAAVVLDTVLGTLEVLDMPTYVVKDSKGKKKTRIDAQALAEWLKGRGIASAAVEKVAARPDQGVSSMFTFGRALGAVEGVLGALNIPISWYQPKEWQKICRVAGGEHVKANARAKAAGYFPAYAQHFAPVIKGSGRADATLIAYAKAKEWGI